MSAAKMPDFPIAIIGMAFRFPGDHSDEEQFWAALREGRDLVGRIGSERWATELLQHPKRSEAGRSVTFSAGVLSHIDQFDASFFRISPREAAWLDPQQRLLLELSWEAMENGALRPTSLAGTDCAVYIGISGVDYGLRVIDDLSAMTAYSMTGNTLGNAANRLSYAFDLRGPSVAVDTACSSSLVALHHACTSLHAGESSVALVGGVNLLLHPYPFIGFTKASMLSANGRCRAFDASGDGYVRAEGGVVLLLKPLDKAQADGDAVQAVILATGTNADGGRKSGITIPSDAGQADLMQAVLRRSGLAPDDVDYIEAHGTGTAVGDPVEATAIGAVYGRCRSQGQPLPIGSLKTNLGHMEPASGLAGLIKSVLVLKNRALPPSLHLATPNPNIDFAALNLDVVNNYRTFPKASRKLLAAGVNSFGFGGTNAHVLLQEFRRMEPPPRHTEPASPPLILSARTPQALCDLAGRYARLIRHRPDALYDIAYAAAYRRDRLEKRLALTGSEPTDMAEQLAAFSQGGTARRSVIEDALAQPAGIAFIYSGNGAQWLGMGRRLLVESPRFSEIVTDLNVRIRALASFSILDELQTETGNSHLDDTAVAQPLLFAIQIALTTLLRERGVDAQAVAGHSVGEVAAAWAAGIFSLDQAVQIVCARSAAQAATRGAGRMAAVGLAEDVARELIAHEHFQDIEIAAVNSPNNITVSGALATLQRLETILISRGIFYRLLDLDYAFHSRSMDAIEGDLATRLPGLAPTAATGPVYVSTVTGAVLEGRALNARYWWYNVRHPVRFAQAMATLIDQGCRIFVEIGPHAILQRYIGECVAAQGIAARVLPTLWRDEDGLERIEEIALRVHLLADPPRLEVFFPQPGRQIRLPNYPWQRERHWHPTTSDGYSLYARQRVHPLLGWRLKEAPASWENVLDLATCPWLADHKVAEAVVLPGAAYLEMALAAAREYFGGTRHELEQVDILVPIVFDGEHARSVRFELSTRDGSFQIRSRQRLSEDQWTLNATGRLPGTPVVTQPISSVRDVPDEPEVVVIDHATHYALTAALGLGYGPSFHGFERAEIQGETLRGTLALPAEVCETAPQFLIHPAVLDVCFQSLVDFFKRAIDAGRGVLFLPVKLGRLSYYSSAPVVRFRACVRRHSARSVLVDFELLDAAGETVVILADCRFRAAAVQRRGHDEAACWKIVSHLRPLAVEQQASGLPSCQELAKQLSRWFTGAEDGLQRRAYFQGALPLFEALTVAFARDAFQELFVRRGDWLRSALDAPERIDTAVRPFFVWMMRILEQDNLLVRHPADGWRLEESDLPAAQNIWRTLLRDYPANLPELVFAARVGRHLAAVLSGETDGHTLAEGLGRSHQIETLFTDSPAYSGSRLGVTQILRIIAADWPVQRRLRVLEIDVGESGVARQFIEVFPASQLDYVIAHADEEACVRLQAEYAGCPSVNVVQLDEDLLHAASDGALPEQFDLIILRHCVHRSHHPADMLAAARRKLARGGLLVLAERHPDFAADFVAGLDPHWWRETLEGGSVSRLMPPQMWAHKLTEQAFVDIEIFREPAGEGLVEGAYLLLAKRPVDDALPKVEPAVANWLLISDTSGPSRQLGNRLQRLLESHGQRVAIATVGRADGEAGASGSLQDAVSAAALLTVARDSLGKLGHVVYLSGLADVDDLLEYAPPISETERAAVPSRRFQKKSHGRVAAALHLVQALGRVTAPPRLWLVTSGGALADDLPNGRSGAPAQAAVWGFGRVVMNEYPALDCTLVDLDIDPAASEAADRLRDELIYPDGEKEIVLSARGRFVLRIERALRKTQRNVMETPARFRLDFRSPGQLRNLLWLPQIERQLADDEVEVRVMATGLNFRDVMYLMGLLPDEAVETGFAGATLGLECAGVVTRVGKRIDALAVGDAVLGFGPACFASHVITKGNAVTHKPADWSFVAAATVPTVFFTVYYALKHLADMQPGERVLIHGAAGGVGIAAVQLALHLGAEVFATAGSEEKRDFVKLLGADHVFDSRSMAFADEILASTDGAGVDVILNSLAGEAIRRNLRILKPFGRFLELGKRDFFENTPVGLRPFKDNISYFGVDADQLLVARPALAAQLFREVMTLFRNGALFPLPYRVFAADRVVEAFRTMQQARQIGKVVVTFDGAQVAVETTEPVIAPVEFKRDANWLVTGGLAGFGLASARWLAERGVGHLVLVGRRGLQTPDAAQAVRELEALGVEVKVVACDVADRVAVQSMLRDMRRNCPPLTGILHAAMVLDDALIATLDADRLHKVLAPKLLGACNLHSLTLDIPLEYFVLYSSVTTFIGNPGQANYVAANAALESLTALRRGLGLAATCIGWGPIADAGYLTRNQAVKDSLTARLGAAPLPARDALSALDYLLANNAGMTAVANIDWSTLLPLLPSARGSRFDTVRRQTGPRADTGGECVDIHGLIAGKMAEQVQEIVQSLVGQEVAQILCIGADRIDPRRSLHDLGMDSLMAVELALGLETRFGIQLPAMMLGEGPSVERVATRIVARLLGADDQDEASGGDRLDVAVNTLAAQHGEEISADDLVQTAKQVREQVRDGTRSVQ